MAEKDYTEITINVLMNDYSETKKNFFAATEDKAKLSGIFATFFGALIGAGYLKYIDSKLIFIFFPYLAALYLFIYGQKETEYWVAYLYLENIERRINGLLNAKTMSYFLEYKRFIFPNKKSAKSIVCIMQYFRSIPAILLFAYIGVLLQTKFELFSNKSWLEISIFSFGCLCSLIGIGFVKWAKIGTNKIFSKNPVNTNK